MCASLDPSEGGKPKRSVPGLLVLQEVVREGEVYLLRPARRDDDWPVSIAARGRPPGLQGPVYNAGPECTFLP